MKHNNLLAFFLSIILFSFYAKAEQKEDLTKYVNPFIGTGGHGHTYPGPTMPFGMVQLSPDSRLEGWDGCSGYHYSDLAIYGFSHTHLSGTGCSDYGDILLMPVSRMANEPFEFSNKNYLSPFQKKNESAGPGYYSVLLDKYNVKAELTATARCGVHKYTFPEGKTASILIDLLHRDEVLDSRFKIVGDSIVTGFRNSRAWADNQQVFFAIKFSAKFKSCVIAKDNKEINVAVKEISGKNLKAYFVFSNEKEIIAKVGISSVSEENAMLNLNSEAVPFSFDQILQKAKDEWNKELEKITISSDDKDKKTVFYSALYHTFVVPNIFNDVNGEYRGRDNKIHKIDKYDYYTVFSLWDTFRAAHPLYTITQQKRTKDFVNTFLNEYKYGKLLPVWELWSSETYCMIGYNAVPVLYDAIVKMKGDPKSNFGFDYNYILEAMKHSADTSLFGLNYFQKYNFLMSDVENESVSKTLEYGYDDWCISQMAKLTKSDADYKRFTIRSQAYKNLFDNKSNFIRARYNGGWYEPFEPTEVNNNYTEANCWQYNFFVPHDLTTYMKMYGGKEKFGKKLDELFTATSKTTGREQADISGLIGQYAHGNEPSHHIAYLYNYAAEPWKTQKAIHKICNEFYKNDPDGLIGNEDCGQMSAWYVLSSMGFYQVCPGNTEYSIGTPLFESATINLENGKTFSIKAKNLSDKNLYIQSAKLNGKVYTKCFISHEDLMNGGVLEFTMAETPNEKWGSGENDIPKTEVKDFQIATAPLIISEKKVFRNSQIIKIECESKSAEIRFTLDGSEPTAKSPIYKTPFEINSTIIVNAKAFYKNSESATISARFYRIPDDRSINCLSIYNPQYSAGGKDGLIDGIRGEHNFRLGGWQGFQGQDFEAILDLGKVQSVKRIAAGFLQDVRAWIWYPRSVEFSVSEDGVNFKQVADIITSDSDKDYNVVKKDYEAKVSSSFRYLKVKAKKYGEIPEWHQGAGGEGFIFIDEIIVE